MSRTTLTDITPSCLTQTTTTTRRNATVWLAESKTAPYQADVMSKDVVYKATVERTDDNTVETYTGLTTSFKKRYNKHTSDIRNQGQKKATKLSGHIWNLKETSIPYNLSWDIIARAPSFNPTTKVCRLCLEEIYHIMWSKEGATLNKRDELFGYCKHRWKHLLTKT